MEEVNVYSLDGTPLPKKISLDDRIVRARIHKHAIYLDVRAILASKRSGTHKTKERSEVHGSTRKLRPQKHLGRARVGSITNPIFRHGGTVFGPRPRKYHLKVNKKVKLLARIGALSYAFQNDKLKIIENINDSNIKTKDIAKFLKAFKINYKKDKTLLVVSAESKIKKATRNIQTLQLKNWRTLNTYDILSVKNVFFTEEAITSLQEALLKQIEKRKIKTHERSENAA